MHDPLDPDQLCQVRLGMLNDLHAQIAATERRADWWRDACAASDFLGIKVQEDRDLLRLRLAGQIEEADEVHRADEASMNTLVAALAKIIEMNRQYCIDRHGDADKVEGMSCVRIAREAIGKVMLHLLPQKGGQVVPTAAPQFRGAGTFSPELGKSPTPPYGHVRIVPLKEFRLMEARLAAAEARAETLETQVSEDHDLAIQAVLAREDAEDLAKGLDARAFFSASNALDDRDLVERIAMDIGKETAHHIETQYPEAFKGASRNMLLSVRNTVFNSIISALDHTDPEDIERWLRERAAHRRRIKRMRTMTTRAAS